MNQSERYQSMAAQYRESGGTWPASARQMAEWAIQNGMTGPHRNYLLNQIAEDFSRALREEHYTDPQGRSVRTKHCARVAVNGKQLALWGDIRTEDVEFMQNAFQWRRSIIVGDCRQLKADVNSFNDNRHPAEPIQVSFNFEQDLAEIEAMEALEAMEAAA